jgi:hypothetical protein
MSDFAGQDFDFAAGSVFGLRGWNMDKYGRLHGVTHEEVWRPGENVAVCKQEKHIPCPAVNRREEARKASEAGRAQVESKKSKKKRNRNDILSEWYVGLHTSEPSRYYPRVACGDPTCVRGEYHVVDSGHRFDPSCECGFWAYDEAGFKAHGRVVGVIEGYGKTTVGTKGFRCEKARIVALSCENGEGERLSRSVLARLATLYPEVTFADDFDALVDAYPGVLREWPEVDEHFWLKPVEPKRESWTWYQSMTSAAFTIPAVPNRYFSGGIV